MGRNVAERLKDGGIDAKKGTAIHVPIADIWAPPKGHALFHPRFGDPVDRAMVDDIKERGIEKPIKVRDDGEQPDGKRRLTLVDGGRRTRNGLEAQRELGQTLYAPIVFWSGTDAELLIERLKSNADPLKRADKASVLALTVAQIKALGPLDAKAVASGLGVKPAIVEALSRWKDLVPDLRPRFDSGEIQIDLLPAILDAPRDGQVALADKLLRDGIKTTKGATRARRKAQAERDPWARRMSPRQAGKVADVLMGVDMIDRCKGLLGDVQVAQHVAIGMALATRKGDPSDLIKTLPKPIADAIREARAKGRKA